MVATLVLIRGTRSDFVMAVIISPLKLAKIWHGMAWQQFQAVVPHEDHEDAVSMCVDRLSECPLIV